MAFQIRRVQLREVFLSGTFSERLSRGDLRDSEAEMRFHRLRIPAHGRTLYTSTFKSKSSICSVIRSSFDRRVHGTCLYSYIPSQVEGHCCPYCGGRVSTSKKPISLAMVQSAADEALEAYAEKVAWHIRRTWNGAVEVLVKERGEYSGVTIEEVVENLREILQSWCAYIPSFSISNGFLSVTREMVSRLVASGNQDRIGISR